MVADNASSKIYLFGGNDVEKYYNDLWVYVNDDWQVIIPTNTPITPINAFPSPRTATALAYNVNAQNN
ncbi:MAG: hypothetical protein B6242_09785 [Anaerolineaceae bacterium 4572_78]|nr:MAG: hypothetical protein B6242_09785 [Anaerolineaceae bacterium 4572_78]